MTETLDTLPKLLAHNAANWPDEIALREKDLGIWNAISWAQYNDRVRQFALAMRQLGIVQGDVVALIGDNRPDWVMGEVASHAAGAMSLGIYRDALDAEIEYLLTYAEAKLVLAEVKRLAHRVTVLRDGKNAGELSEDDIDHDAMVKLMVGREASTLYQYEPHPLGETALQVDGLVTQTFPEHRLSFEVKAGEIVGVAGLVGAGRTEMLAALFGIDPPLAGRVSVLGGPVVINTPRQAIRAGLALVPEDRKLQGVILDMSIRENTSMTKLSDDAYAGLVINAGEEKRLAQDMNDRLATKTPTVEQQVQNLSGGNQQKVVIAKWLAAEPRVLLMDEPTRGVDIGAKAEIYRIMEELAQQGVAVLFVSSDLEEVLGVSDRVLVMHEGQITGELARNQLSAEAVMAMATNTHATSPA